MAEPSSREISGEQAEHAPDFLASRVGWLTPHARSSPLAAAARPKPQPPGNGRVRASPATGTRLLLDMSLLSPGKGALAMKPHCRSCGIVLGCPLPDQLTQPSDFGLREEGMGAKWNIGSSTARFEKWLYNVPAGKAFVRLQSTAAHLHQTLPLFISGVLAHSLHGQALLLCAVLAAVGLCLTLGRRGRVCRLLLPRLAVLLLLLQLQRRGGAQPAAGEATQL